jgi:hypothetical protein
MSDSSLLDHRLHRPPEKKMTSKWTCRSTMQAKRKRRMWRQFIQNHRAPFTSVSQERVEWSRIYPLRPYDTPQFLPLNNHQQNFLQSREASSRFRQARDQKHWAKMKGQMN